MNTNEPRYGVQVNTGAEGWRYVAGWGGDTREEARDSAARARKHWDRVRVPDETGKRDICTGRWLSKA